MTAKYGRSTESAGDKRGSKPTLGVQEVSNSDISLRRFGLPSHTHGAVGARRAPERRSGEALGPGSFHCPDWQLQPSDKSEGS